MRVAWLTFRHSSGRSGIDDYADNFRRAMLGVGCQFDFPLQAPLTSDAASSMAERMATVDWSRFQLAHAELGGGRNLEFLALEWLAAHYPDLPLTATVHDPERLIWRPLDLPPLLAAPARRSAAAHKLATLLYDPWMLARERRLAERISSLVTLTRTGADCLRQRMGLREDKVATVPHGNASVAASPLSPAEPLKVLYFGFIHRGKGLEDLLTAFARLLAKQSRNRTRIRLTVSGGTRPEMTFGHDGGYLGGLEKMASRLGLDSSTLQWELDVPPDSIVSLIQSHHVMVLPYRESRKLSFLGQNRATSGALSWAAACGRSVITSNARAFAEEVSYGNGAVYPQGRVAALEGELERLLDEPQLLIERTRRAQAIGQQRQWPLVARQFKAVFEAAAGG